MDSFRYFDVFFELRRVRRVVGVVLWQVQTHVRSTPSLSV